MDYEIVWTENALTDLERIVRFLLNRNPPGKHLLVQQISTCHFGSCLSDNSGFVIQ
jgi:hypothetical protein